MYVKIQIRLYLVICYLIIHIYLFIFLFIQHLFIALYTTKYALMRYYIVHNMCQSPTSAALAVSCVFYIKVLEKCTKNLIGHSRLAFSNHESNIDC